MSRASPAASAGRIALLLEALRRTYPRARCELHYSNPLELLVATILSAQCADRQVNRVTESLFRRYRTAADYARAPLADLQGAIRQLGLFRTKARSLQACCRVIADRHGGMVPDTLEALVQLQGVGRKTANVVLGNAFGRNEGIVVDTHVARLARRLGLTRETHPEKIERDLMTVVPRKTWTSFSHWLIWHGRRRCAARKPACPLCELRTLCPSREADGVRTHEQTPARAAARGS